MEHYTPDFSLDVAGVRGLCPAGEAYAKEQIEARTISVFSCEGPCIRGEIATRNVGVRRPTPCKPRRCVSASPGVSSRSPT